MSERVEEIRRQHRMECTGPGPCHGCDLLTALAQAEREREEARAERNARARDVMHLEAEVERLKAMDERVEEIRRQHVSAGPYMVHEPTRDCDVCALLTALARVRAALRLLADAADGEGRAGSTIQVAVDKARAALEGR